MITEEEAKPQKNLLPCLPGPNQWDSRSAGETSHSPPFDVKIIRPTS